MKQAPPRNGAFVFLRRVLDVRPEAQEGTPSQNKSSTALANLLQCSCLMIGARIYTPRGSFAALVHLAKQRAAVRMMISIKALPRMEAATEALHQRTKPTERDGILSVNGDYVVVKWQSA